MNNFRTYQLAVEFYKSAKLINIKSLIVKDQFERAILSVVLNLAEGSGKGTAKDRRRFYQIALGSLREVQSILQLIDENEHKKSADILGAHIYKLILNPGCLQL